MIDEKWNSPEYIEGRDTSKRIKLDIKLKG